MLEEKHVGVKC